MVTIYLDNGVSLTKLAEAQGLDEAWDFMVEDLKSKNINPPYYRVWDKDNIRTIDFGSHSYFYQFHF